MAVDVDRVESTLFVPIQKTEEMPDGSVMVYGLASGPDTDLDGQRMDPDWLKKAMPEWMVFGNIREMHQAKAVGKAKEYQWTDEGPYISAKIIDPEAVKKVKEGVYSGFSIGVKNAKIEPDPEAPRGRIVDGKIIEVSVVDYPAYPKAKFDLVKAAESGGWHDVQTGVVLEKEVQAPDVEKAVWSTAYVNDLPDSCFAYIEPGGKKDKEGKTVPRSLRHLPYKDKDGRIDPAHVRNALQRLPQTKIPEAAKEKARKKLIAAAKKVGIKVDTEKEVKKVEKTTVDLSPEAEAQDAARMEDIAEQLQSVIPELQDLIEREQSEVEAGDEGDVQDVKGLKETMENLTAAIQSLVSVLNHEKSEAEKGDEEKTLSTASGLSAYNLDGKPKTDKAADPDLEKVGRKMAKERMDKLSNITSQFKDLVAAMEELMRELGDSSFEGGDSNNPKNEGGEPMRQTEHKEPNPAEDLGAMKGAMGDALKDGDIAMIARALKEASIEDIARALCAMKDKNVDIAEMARALQAKDADVAMMAKSIGEAVAASLAKAGVIQAKPENELLAKFSELEARLKRIENQPAEAQAVAIPIDRRHVLDPEKKKSYEGAVSTLAQQVADMSEREREQLATEIIKMINSR